MEVSKKILILVFVILSCASFVEGINMKKLSGKIVLVQTASVYDPTDQREINFLNAYHHLRMKMNIFNNFDINTQSDTLYILQDQTDGTYTSLLMIVWNNKKNILYRAIDERDDRGNFIKTKIEKEENVKYPEFEYMKLFITRWDIKELMCESKMNGFLGSNYIATRVIFKNGKYIISSIEFAEFYDFKKDPSGPYGYAR